MPYDSEGEYYEGNTEPLHYSRERIVEILRERLEEARGKRLEEARARAEKNQVAIKAIVDSLGNEGFLLHLVGLLDRRYSFPLDEKFAENVAKHHGDHGDPGSFTPSNEEELERLIRVYSNATDDVVQVDVATSVYRYL